MIQPLSSLSSHGCAQARTRQILHVRSWLPVDNDCSLKCPSNHLTALTQTLANSQQSSSLLVNYCPTTIDDVLLTKYLTASHVHACTPMATLKNPYSTRQTTQQRHTNVMPTTAKQTVSTPKATAKHLVFVLYVAVLRQPCSLTPYPHQLPTTRQIPLQRPAKCPLSLCHHITNHRKSGILRSTVSTMPSCQSLVTHLRFTCPKIATPLRENWQPIIYLFPRYLPQIPSILRNNSVNIALWSNRTPTLMNSWFPTNAPLNDATIVPSTSTVCHPSWMMMTLTSTIPGTLILMYSSTSCYNHPCLSMQ